MIGNALRVGIGIGLATLCAAGSSQAQLSRTATRPRPPAPIAPVATAPVPAPTPAPAPAPLAAALIGSDNLAVSIFQGPHLTVYGKRAVFYWHGGSDLVLSVAFGPTGALGTSAVEPTRLDFTEPLRGGTPTLVLHKVTLDGLELNTPYFYRGTLTRSGVVVGDTGILPFQTPLAFARVRPVEIEMHKDGDHDLQVSAFGEELYDNDNEGEVYLEWSTKLRRAPGDHPWTPKVKGCFPGGFSIPTSFPENDPNVHTPYEDESDDGSDLGYPENPETPDIEAPDDWQAVGGCRAYSYSDPVDVNSAKVGSGDLVELDADDYPALEWDLGADTTSGLLGMANALPIDADGDGEPDWGPNGPPQGAPEEEPEEPCANGAFGTQALVRLGTRGQEFDTTTSIGTSGGAFTDLTRIINHDVSDAELLCLDLRDEEKSYLVGVRAGSGSFEFTTWFEVTLDYRLPGEPPPADEELEALATPIVIAP